MREKNIEKKNIMALFLRGITYPRVEKNRL